MKYWSPGARTLVFLGAGIQACLPLLSVSTALLKTNIALLGICNICYQLYEQLNPSWLRLDRPVSAVFYNCTWTSSVLYPGLGVR